MPRFFFNVHDDRKGAQTDTDGLSFETIEQIRKEAQRLLPEIAYSEIPADGDHRSYMVLVTDESGRPVYSAALNYQGHKISDIPEPASSSSTRR